MKTRKNDGRRAAPRYHLLPDVEVREAVLHYARKGWDARTIVSQLESAGWKNRRINLEIKAAEVYVAEWRASVGFCPEMRGTLPAPNAGMRKLAMFRNPGMAG